MFRCFLQHSRLQFAGAVSTPEVHDLSGGTDTMSRFRNASLMKARSTRPSPSHADVRPCAPLPDNV
jgi:hypothetical protein